jgi:hypothetical protein
MSQIGDNGHHYKFSNKTEVRKFLGTIYRTVAPNNYGSSAYNVLPVTYLTPRILTWLLDLKKNRIAINYNI